MEKLTAVFPIAAIAFILLVFSEYLPALKNAGQILLLPRPKRLERADGKAILILTAVYAITAFWGLGDGSAPQSFCKFEERGHFAVAEFPGETELSGLMYYTGLYTGSYYVQISSDGENFEDVAILEQKHSDLFKWISFDFEDGTKAKFIRIISDSTLWLGELALFDENGALMDSESFLHRSGVSTLFDEQELVPEMPTYLNGAYFDEIYHARTAYEHVQNVYPYEVSHPPLGKLIISIGIQLFGMTPLGWRFMGTLFGALMLPILYIFLKKLFGTVVIPSCCTLIFAFDFMHFVQTRIATIDTYSVFFILLTYLFMYIYLSSDRERRVSYVALALCGIFFGLGAASKWTCIYAGAGLFVLWLWERVCRGIKMCKGGEGRKYAKETFNNVLCCLLFFIVIPCAIYYTSYLPYGIAREIGFFDREFFDLVIENQKFMFTYHAGVSAEHPYSSNWYEWVLNLRPILYYLRYYDGGEVAAIGAFLGPMLSWGGLLAMGAMAYLSVKNRDKKAAFILVGYLSQLVPWMFVSRITFAYHYFPSAVFLTLALGHVFATMREFLPKWRRPVLSFTAVSAALFVVFYPVLTGLTILRWVSDSFLGWLPGWPF